jgi:hypothetical protein
LIHQPFIHPIEHFGTQKNSSLYSHQKMLQTQQRLNNVLEDMNYLYSSKIFMSCQKCGPILLAGITHCFQTRNFFLLSKKHFTCFFVGMLHADKIVVDC